MWDFWWIKWHWDKIFSEFFDFSPVNIIPPGLRTHISGGRTTGSLKGSSSETLSNPIDMNNNNMCFVLSLCRDMS
jgi:hypothetical protein